MNPQRKKCPLQKLAYKILYLGMFRKIYNRITFNKSIPESAEKYFSMKITLEEEASTHRNRLACRT